MLTKDALGANYKVITGYPIGNHLNLAMERGEIHGWTTSWENVVGIKSEWVRENKVDILVQYTIDRLPALKDVPTLTEIAPPGKKDVAEFITFGTPFARALAVGPGAPADRVAALRKAFDDLMQDQAFLDDARKRNLDINPRNAAQVHALVERIAAASPELVARVRRAIGQDD
jgi:tripartite-type tricarboxylate transporter receptor subunit TctC